MYEENKNCCNYKVYRGLQLDSEAVKEYKEGSHFLWPNFSSTSKSKSMAEKFGNYLFEIEISYNGVTYFGDISKYSLFPDEQEVLFYPYSGFSVKKISPDGRVIFLETCDTRNIEGNATIEISNKDVCLYNEQRGIFVHLSSTNTNVYCSKDLDEKYVDVDEYSNGYFDSPYCFRHNNGYFVKRNNQWEEWKYNKLRGTLHEIYEKNTN